MSFESRGTNVSLLDARGKKFTRARVLSLDRWLNGFQPTHFHGNLILDFHLSTKRGERLHYRIELEMKNLIRKNKKRVKGRNIDRQFCVNEIILHMFRRKRQLFRMKPTRSS